MKIKSDDIIKKMGMVFLMSIVTTTITATAFANITDPEVLHRFSKNSAATASETDLGFQPALPPVYNPKNGKLYGLTPRGGTFQGFYGVNYSFTPLAQESDYVGQNSVLNVMAGFYVGLVVNSDGVVFGGANPLNPGLPGPTTGLLFQWTETEGMSNAFSEIDTDSLYGAHFDLRGLPTIDSDNHVYFGGGSDDNGMSLFRRTVQGSLEQLVDFSRPEYIQGNAYLKGHYPAAVIFSENDQALYGLAVKAKQNGPDAGNPQDVPDDLAAGTLFKILKTEFAADGSSPIEILHTFAKEAEGTISGNDSDQNALVEVDEWLYGTTIKAVWRVKKSDPDSFELVHVFGGEDGQVISNDGAEPHGPLVLADDGNIYGTTRTGFTTEDEPDSEAKTGTLYRIKIEGQTATYEQLHIFDPEQEGATPVGLTNGLSENGFHTLYGAAKFGGLAGDTHATGFGTVYRVQVKVPGSLQLAADASEITVGETVTLSWQGEFLETCVGADDFQGNKETSGTEIMTPTQVAAYVYSLNCQDIHGNALTATVDLNVKPEDGRTTPEPNPDPDPNPTNPNPDNNSSSSSGGGVVSNGFLILLGMASLCLRRRTVRRA